jgi:hypothetical protein
MPNSGGEARHNAAGLLVVRSGVASANRDIVGLNTAF